MTLSDVRDFIESLGITENVYQGKMPDKEDKSIGVYNSKHNYPYKTALGGTSCESYGVKYMTFLVHWNKSPQDTEDASNSFHKVGKPEGSPGTLYHGTAPDQERVEDKTGKEHCKEYIQERNGCRTGRHKKCAFTVVRLRGRKKLRR